MKARSREINIFNMSLLDILCGALGAFCFMMLALFPYYKPSKLSAEDKRSYQDAQDTQRKLQQVEQQLQQEGSRPSAQTMQKVRNALDQAQQQLGRTQQQLDRTRAAMEQEQQTEKQAVDTANKEQTQLQMDVPLVVQEWNPESPVTVDLFVREAGINAKNQAAPPFDPSKKGQGPFFSTTQMLIGPRSETWEIGATVPGNYSVYYRLEDASSVTQPVKVIGSYDIKNGFQQFPTIMLSAATPWAMVGNIEVDANRKATFLPASGVSAAPASPGAKR
jgi:hypothetical protein